MLHIKERLVSSMEISQLYEEGTIELHNVDSPVNSYLILRSEIDLKTSALVRHVGKGVVVKMLSKDPHLCGIKPRDSKQAALVDCLLHGMNIPLNIVVGKAGTGKTTLAIAYALSRLEAGYPIYMSKSTALVGKGKAFGPVPGDVQEKYEPFLDSFKIVMKELYGEKASYYFEATPTKGKKLVSFVPIEYVRGNTYKDCTFIIDEAQNLSWHELNTIISRMGDNAKVIVMGDLQQIDVGVRKEYTGLWKMVTSQSFMNSPLTSAIQLEAQYRSPIAELMSNIDEEINGD